MRASLPQPPGRSYRHRYEGPFFRQLMLGGMRWLPGPVRWLSMPLWSGIFYTLLPEARRAVRRNLAQVLGNPPPGELKRRTYQLFLNYAQTLSDGYGLHFGRGRQLPIKRIHYDRMHQALAGGKGAISVTGHLGLWQLAPFLIEQAELPPFYMAMAEEPNPLVQEFERRHRERFRIIYTTGSMFSSLELLAVLRSGAILGMQMDRHLGSKTVALPFCGRPAHFALGPAVLSRLSGAPLVPSFFIFEPEAWSRSRRLLHHVAPAIEVPHTADRERDILDATRRLVEVYEHYVRRYATQWYAFHDFWADPAAPKPHPNAHGAPTGDEKSGAEETN